LHHDLIIIDLKHEKTQTQGAYGGEKNNPKHQE